MVMTAKKHSLSKLNYAERMFFYSDIIFQNFKTAQSFRAAANPGLTSQFAVHRFTFCFSGK